MGLNFPSAPSVGQKYPAPSQPGIPTYAWDGEKWTTVATAGSAGSLPSNNNPLRNDIAAPGGFDAYARGDHRHPTDSSRAPIDNPSFTGTVTASMFECPGNAALASVNVTTLKVAGSSNFGALTTAALSVSAAPVFGGTVRSQAKGHRIGSIGGVYAYQALTPADANVKLYHHDATSWAGIGADVNGTMWFRTGYSANTAGGIQLQNDQVCGFLNIPSAPTPAAGDNSNKAATTAFVKANVPTGAFLPLTGGTLTGTLVVSGGDIRTHRGNNTGVIFFGNTGHYIFFDGTNFSLPGGACWSAASRLWGNADFGFPVTNARLAYAGDYSHNSGASLTEPYGAMQTGSGGTYWAGPPYGPMLRYRYMQLLTSSWWSIGFA